MRITVAAMAVVLLLTGMAQAERDTIFLDDLEAALMSRKTTLEELEDPTSAQKKELKAVCKCLKQLAKDSDSLGGDLKIAKKCAAQLDKRLVVEDPGGHEGRPGQPGPGGIEPSTPLDGTEAGGQGHRELVRGHCPSRA